MQISLVLLDLIMVNFNEIKSDPISKGMKLKKIKRTNELKG